MRLEYITYPNNLPIKITYASIEEYPIHWHNSIELIYVLEGKLKIDIYTETYELYQNEIEIINIEECHRLYSEENNKVLIFHIDPYFFEQYYKDIANIFFYTNSSDLGAQEFEKYDDLRFFLSSLLCEAVQKLDDYDNEIEGILIDLLYHLINNFHYLTYEKEDLKDKTDQLDRYHRISKYIFNNYNNNITLQDIAKKEFLSPHYLSHEIKVATGYSFTDLLNQTRVEESIKLLLSSDLSLSDICDEVGFSHIRYFNKNFKDYYGCTPLQYRKKFKISDELLEKQKVISFLNLEDALESLSYELQDYERFNSDNKIWKIHIDMANSEGSLDTTFKDIINLGDAFDLLIEDNKDILEEMQEEINFSYGRLENLFSDDMGIFKNSSFYNWNKTKSVIEFLDSLSINPLIIIDNLQFTLSKYTEVIISFYDYFDDLNYIDMSDFKFQFSPKISKDIKNSLTAFLINNYNAKVLQDTFHSEKELNKIYDTTFMLPYIIHNTFFSKDNLSFLRAFDVLEKEINLNNEVFIGAPGVVNDMAIRKPSYYAYYLLSKLKGELVKLETGCIVTKDDDEYSILLYSHNDDLDNLPNYEDIYKKRTAINGSIKKLSLNIVNIPKSVRITTYEIDDKIGSSYNYWLAMGAPDRLNKEEKEILYKASFPKIDFRSSKKSTVLNIISEIKGYGAKLILLKT